MENKGSSSTGSESLEALMGTETFSKDTFLTSLLDSEGIKLQQDKFFVPDPEGMKQVRHQFKDLSRVVASLSDQIGAVMGKQEQDFLAAYRAHMYKVQKDVQDLKQQLEQSENGDQKQEKLKSMEDERNWYRKEALRLDSFAVSMKSDLAAMREKLESLEEDRDWLDGQLKISKKENKALRAELQLRSQEKSFTDSQSIDSSRERDQALACENENEQRYLKQIKLLKRDVTNCNKTIAKLRNSVHEKHEKSVQQSELELLFLQCIDDVKREVAKRQNATEKRKHMMGFIGQNKVQLNDFNSSDKVQVIENLLSHDEVLSFLYDNIFAKAEPAKPESPGQNITSANLCRTTESENGDQIVSKKLLGNRDISTRIAPAGSGAAAVSAHRGVALNETTAKFLRQN